MANTSRTDRITPETLSVRGINPNLPSRQRTVCGPSSHDSTVRVARTAVEVHRISFFAFYFGTVLPPEVVPIVRGGHANASTPVSTCLGVRLFTSVTMRGLPGEVSR
jgi:hypothetical protein